MNIMKVIRLRLDELLRQKQMTRYELAKRSGIKFQTIDNYYKNRVTRYDGDVMLRICDILSCDVGELLHINVM